MDDVLVFGRDQEQHNKTKAWGCAMQSTVTPNNSKCEFSKNQIKFLGHIFDEDGVRAR